MGRNTPTIKELLNSAKTGHSVAVNATATVTTESLKLDKHEGFMVFYQASSGGTIDLDVVLQVSFDGTNWDTLDAAPKIHNDLADTDLHSKFLNVPMTPYMRISVTGGASNAATTKIGFWLSY